MKKEVETLKNLYEILDETYDCFKDGEVGIVVNKLTNEKNKRNGIISEIPE